MTIFDDLNTAVTTVTDSFNKLDEAIQAEIAAIQNGLNTGNSPAIQSAIDSLGKLSARMTADVASLAASITPTVTPPSTSTTWSATNTYKVGDVVLGTDGKSYTSTLVDNLNINPVGDQTGAWTVAPSSLVSSTFVKSTATVSSSAPWSATVAYKVDDRVTEQGTSYKALLTNTNVNPVGNPTTWVVI